MMKWANPRMRRPLASFCVGALLVLSGCGQGSSIRAEKPIAEVHSILAALDELPPVFGGNDPDVRVDAGDPKSVTWVLSIEREEMMSFVANLEASGDAETSVRMAVKPGLPKFEKRLNENPEIRDFYLSAMTEQVASTLQDRPFDLTRTSGAMRKAIVANMGNMIKDVEAADAEAQKRERDNIRRAYEREAAGEKF